MTEIVTRAEAEARGLKRYFTGKPCKRGHYAERYVNSPCCLQCHKEYKSTPAQMKRSSERTNAWNKRNPDKRRAIERKWRRANRDTVYARHARWKAKNPERVRELQRKYNKSHRGKKRTRQNKISDVIAALRAINHPILREAGL